jgi:hypothetical protein
VPTFSVSGTIAETAPTPSQRVAGVDVTVGNASATTNANGDFTVTGVPAGSYTLTASRSDYQTTTMSVTVSSGDVSGIRIALRPSPRLMDVGFDGVLSPGDPGCHGTSRPCDTYAAGAHNDGNIQIFLLWKNPNTDLDLELRCDDEFIDVSIPGSTPQFDELHPTPIKGGRACVAHVIHRNGPETLYSIYLKYPY